MYSTRTSGLLLLAVALVGFLTACEQPSTSDVDQTDQGVLRLGSVEAVDTVSRGVSPNDRPLVIDGFRGSVSLTGTEQESAQLQFVRRGRGEDTETARGVLEDVTISESGSQDSYTYALETDGAAYAEVDVTGTVPEDTELRVEQSSGPVEILGVSGPLTVEHENGPVTIRGVAASVEVQIRNGDVEVQHATLPPDASVSIRTANGDITFRLPPATSTQLRARTSAGVIRTHGLPLSQQRFRPRDAGGEYSAQIGPGEASVELQTKNGSIFIGPRRAVQDDTTTTDRQGQDEEEATPVPQTDTVITPDMPVDTMGRDANQPDTTATDTT